MELKVGQEISIDEFNQSFPEDSSAPLQVGEEIPIYDYGKIDTFEQDPITQIEKFEQTADEDYDIDLASHYESIENGTPLEEARSVFRQELDNTRRAEFDNLAPEVKKEYIGNKYGMNLFQEASGQVPLGKEITENKEITDTIFRSIKNLGAGALRTLLSSPETAYQYALNWAQNMEETSVKDKSLKENFKKAMTTPWFAMPYKLMKDELEVQLKKRTNVDKKVANWAIKKLDKHRKGLDILGLKQTGEGFVDDLAFGLGSGIVSLGEALALGMAGAPALAGVVFGAKEKGQFYETAIRRGVDPKTADMLSTASGVLEAVLETVGVGKLLDNTIGSFAMRALKGAAIEGSEEFTQTLKTKGLEAVYRDDVDAKYVKESFQEALFAGLIGSILGGGAGGVNVGTYQEGGMAKPEFGTIKPNIALDEAVSKLNEAGIPKDVTQQAIVDGVELLKEKLPEAIDTQEQAKPKGEKITYKDADYVVSKEFEGDKPYKVTKVDAEGNAIHELEPKGEDYVAKLREKPEAKKPKKPIVKPVGKESVVKLHKNPRKYTLVKKEIQTPEELELGEQYYTIKDAKTGEIQVVEQGDIHNIKGIDDKVFASMEPTKEPASQTKPVKPVITKEQIKHAERKKEVLKKQLNIESAKEANEGVVKMIRDRRYYLNEKSFDTNLFINDIEKVTTKEQREVIPFLIEKTNVPSELGRKDLEKVYNESKANLQPIAQQVKKHFDDGWKYMQENMDDMSAKQIEDYITHIWEIPKDKTSEITNWFTTRNRFLKKRFIETYKEGIVKHGLKPKTLNVSDIIRIHDSVMHKAVANKRFVDTLNTMKVDGVPVIERADKAPKDWVTIDHPSLRKGLVIPGEMQRGEKVSKELGSILSEMGVAIGRRISPVVFGKPSKKAGEYRSYARKYAPEIRLQRFFETKTVAHEIGHHLDSTLNLGQEFIDKYKDEIYALNESRIKELKGKMPKSWNKGGVEYAETSEEQIAELFAHIFADTDKAFKIAPNASADVMARLKEEGTLTKLIDLDFENKAKDLIEEQLNTMVKLPVKVHPDLAKALKVIFDSKFNSPFLQGMETVNGYLKKLRLSLSLFHHVALGETSTATIGLKKTLGIYGNIPKIYKALVKNEHDVFKNEPLARDAISHGVKLGATADIPVAKIQQQLNALAEKTKNIPLINKTTKLLSSFNETWDKFLWNYLHDNMKLYGYESLVSKMGKKATPENIDMLKEEVAQFVNDTYGGQNWDVLMVNPKNLQIMSLALLSPDWTYSTIRQGMAAAGVGTLNTEMKKTRLKMGANFWIKAIVYFGMGMNALNYLFRKWDEKENPEYYKDQEVKFWDRTMLGNTIGHKTHLFVGRYENGQERYIRWGKQFREVPELLFDDTGFSPVSASLRKAGGKVSPVVDTVSKTFTGVSPSGFKSRNITDEKGWERVRGIAEELITSPVPYSMRSVFEKNKEFHLTDIAFPSSKGLSRYKAIDLFKTSIKAKDLQLMKETWHGAMINGLPPESLYKAALTSLKAENTTEKNRAVKDLEDVEKKFNKADNPTDKSIYHRKRIRLQKEKYDWEHGLENLERAIKQFEQEAE